MPPVRMLFVKPICNRMSFCRWQKWAWFPQDSKRSLLGNILGKLLCSLSYVENGGNYVENYSLGKSVSIEGKKKERTKTKQFYKNGSQLRELGKLSTEWF